jgi:hypothetical protein
MRALKGGIVAAAICVALFSAGGAAALTTEELGQLIFERYPYTYTYGGNPTSGKLDKSWCRHVEMERYVMQWDLPDGTFVDAKQAGRIETTYVDADGILNYSSIFLALVGPTIKQSGVVAYSATPPAKAARTVTPKGSVTIEDCPASLGHADKDKDFLQAFVRPLFFKSATNAMPMNGSKVWVFEGRPHNVYAITKYPIVLEDSNGKTVPDTFLVVGYGGGSGP